MGGDKRTETIHYILNGAACDLSLTSDYEELNNLMGDLMEGSLFAPLSQGSTAEKRHC